MVTVYFRSSSPIPRRRCSRAAATGSTFKGPTLPVLRRSAHVCVHAVGPPITERRNFFFSLPAGEKNPGAPQEIFRIRVLKSPLTGALLQQCLPPFWRVERTRGGQRTAKQGRRNQTSSSCGWEGENEKKGGGGGVTKQQLRYDEEPPSSRFGCFARERSTQRG